VRLKAKYYPGFQVQGTVLQNLNNPLNIIVACGGKISMKLTSSTGLKDMMVKTGEGGLGKLAWLYKYVNVTA
jgi:hypothetical protein